MIRYKAKADERGMIYVKATERSISIGLGMSSRIDPTIWFFVRNEISDSVISVLRDKPK